MQSTLAKETFTPLSAAEGTYFDAYVANDGLALNRQYTLTERGIEAKEHGTRLWAAEVMPFKMSKIWDDTAFLLFPTCT